MLEIAGTWSCRGSSQCSFGAFGSWTECQLLGSLPWCANWSFKGISVLCLPTFWNAPYLYTWHCDQTCYCYYVAYFLIKHIVAIRLCNGIRRHKVYVIGCQSSWALNFVIATTTLESLRKLVWSDQNFLVSLQTKSVYCQGMLCSSLLAFWLCQTKLDSTHPLWTLK